MILYCHVFLLTPHKYESARLEPRQLLTYSAGTTCLTLLVQHMCSSNVANHVANSISRIRLAMP